MYRVYKVVYVYDRSFAHRIPAAPRGDLPRPALSEPRCRVAAAHVREPHEESRSEPPGTRARAHRRRGRTSADGAQTRRVRAPRAAASRAGRGVEARERRAVKTGASTLQIVYLYDIQ